MEQDKRKAPHEPPRPAASPFLYLRCTCEEGCSILRPQENAIAPVYKLTRQNRDAHATIPTSKSRPNYNVILSTVSPTDDNRLRTAGLTLPKAGGQPQYRSGDARSPRQTPVPRNAQRTSPPLSSPPRRPPRGRSSERGGRAEPREVAEEQQMGRSAVPSGPRRERGVRGRSRRRG